MRIRFRFLFIVILLPGYSLSQYSKPDYSKPDYSKPNYSKPDYSKPDYSKSDYSKPDYSKPDYLNPNSLKSSKKDSVVSWTFNVAADYYIFPGDQNILMLTTMADKNMLHLEARYNYEERNTASVFGGMNFSFGNKLQFTITPMAGIVFGDLNGLAPGLETDLSYKMFYFNSQSEYVFDLSEEENDFVYTYLQLGASLLKNFDLGIAAQRTRLYETNLELQRGVYTTYTFRKLSGTFTYFNPFTDSYFFVASLSIDF